MALFQLLDLQLHNANETTFAVNLGDSFSARSIRAVNSPVLTPAQVVVDNPALRQRLARQLGPILGLKNTSKLTFATALRGTGTAAHTGVTALGAADLAEGQLLANAFGGESLGDGTVVDDVAATSTSIEVADASGLAEGQAILVLVGDGYEASVIGDITTNTLTLTRALSAAPDNGAIVHAAATYYPAESLPGTLQFQTIGAESTDGYHRLLGCTSTMKLGNLAPGQLPQCSWDVMSADWQKYSSATLSSATYSNTVNASVPGLASSLFIADSGSTTRTLVHCSAVSIDPGLGVEKIASVSGTQGLQGYARSGIAPTFDFTIYPFGDAWHDDFSAETAKTIHYQIGSTPGATILIEIQNAVISEVPSRAAVGKQVGTKIKGYGLEDTTIGTGDLARASVRLHLL